MKMIEQSLPRRQGLPKAGRVALLALAAGAVVLLSACGDGKKDKASQTAAKVNKEEITVHQINFVLQRQQNLRPEQAEAASRQVLEQLIDQELAVQKAQDLKLDRDPRVVQQIEAAKREIISRAYIEQVGSTAAKPTAEEVANFYNTRTALFKERRIYSLQEILIEARPDQFDALRDRLKAAKNLGEFADYLKANDFKFVGNQAVRAAEQLPLASLDSIARMKDGESAITTAANGLKVLFLVGSRAQPIELDKARPAIEQFLSNQRKGELVQKEVKALREAAKIEYIGKFAEGAASAPAAQPAPQPASADAAAPAAPAASGLDANSISKGMGLK